jgi:hypothetical protein
MYPLRTDMIPPPGRPVLSASRRPGGRGRDSPRRWRRSVVLHDRYRGLMPLLPLSTNTHLNAAES